MNLEVGIKGGIPVDSIATAHAFVDALGPDPRVIQHIDEIRAAISASRQRRPISVVLEGKSHDKKQEARKIEAQIADLQRQLTKLAA